MSNNNLIEIWKKQTIWIMKLIKIKYLVSIVLSLNDFIMFKMLVCLLTYLNNSQIIQNKVVTKSKLNLLQR
jgi:hypothetical protein